MKHTQWQIKTLGQMSIEQAGVGLKLPLKARALLVYLAVTGKSHSRELLSGLLSGIFSVNLCIFLSMLSV